MRLSLSRSIVALAAASLLAACQGGSANPPAFPPQQSGTQSAAHVPQSAAQAQAAGRSAMSHHDEADFTASPASVHFTADQAAAGTPQTVTVSGRHSGKLAVSIAGTGNCPTVSPSTLSVKGHDEDGDRDHDRKDASSAVITVTPHGAGPATCAITVAPAKSADKDGDRDHHDGDRDHHGDADDTLTIPVTVDAPPTPAPTPTPTDTPAPSPSPTPGR